MHNLTGFLYYERYLPDFSPHSFFAYVDNSTRAAEKTCVMYDRITDKATESQSVSECKTDFFFGTQT